MLNNKSKKSILESATKKINGKKSILESATKKINGKESILESVKNGKESRNNIQNSLLGSIKNGKKSKDTILGSITNKTPSLNGSFLSSMVNGKNNTENKKELTQNVPLELPMKKKNNPNDPNVPNIKFKLYKQGLLLNRFDKIKTIINSMIKITNKIQSKVRIDYTKNITTLEKTLKNTNKNGKNENILLFKKITGYLKDNFSAIQKFNPSSLSIENKNKKRELDNLTSTLMKYFEETPIEITKSDKIIIKYYMQILIDNLYFLFNIDLDIDEKDIFNLNKFYDLMIHNPTKKKSANNEGISNKVIKKESVKKESVNKEGVKNESVINKGINNASVKKESVNKEGINNASVKKEGAKNTTSKTGVKSELINNATNNEGANNKGVKKEGDKKATNKVSFKSEVNNKMTKNEKITNVIQNGGNNNTIKFKLYRNGLILYRFDVINTVLKSILGIIKEIQKKIRNEYKLLFTELKTKNKNKMSISNFGSLLGTLKDSFYKIKEINGNKIIENIQENKKKQMTDTILQDLLKTFQNTPKEITEKNKIKIHYILQNLLNELYFLFQIDLSNHNKNIFNLEKFYNIILSKSKK